MTFVVKGLGSPSLSVSAVNRFCDLCARKGRIGDSDPAAFPPFASFAVTVFWAFRSRALDVGDPGPSCSFVTFVVKGFGSSAPPR